MFRIWRDPDFAQKVFELERGKAGPVSAGKAEPPPPNVNLQGFPLPYREGYADGCASVSGTERKDAARFQSDGQYRTGWQDGHALCRKR